MDEFMKMPEVPEEIFQELRRLQKLQEDLCGAALLQIAQSHERRINRLEGGEEEGS